MSIREYIDTQALACLRDARELQALTWRILRKAKNPELGFAITGNTDH